VTPDAAERRARALLDGHSLARDAAPDLARDVLSLTDALATAERERDRLTACLARANATIEETERARYAAEEERDAAVTGHAALAAAVRAEREARRVARLAQSERDALEDDAWPDGDDDERAALAAAGERLDTAEADHDAKRDHLTALLAGAPCGYVEARVVRESCAAIAENFGRVKAADWATAQAIAEAIRKGDDQ